GGGDDIVAGLPRKAFSDDADALAGVLEEGDVERVGIEEPGGEAANLLDAAGPDVQADAAVAGHLLGPVEQRLASAGTERGHGGVVEEGPVVGAGKLGPQRLPVHVQEHTRRRGGVTRKTGGPVAPS